MRSPLRVNSPSTERFFEKRQLLRVQRHLFLKMNAVMEQMTFFKSLSNNGTKVFEEALHECKVNAPAAAAAVSTEEPKAAALPPQ